MNLPESGGFRCVCPWPSGSKVVFVLMMLKLTCVPFVAPMVLITGLWPPRLVFPVSHLPPPANYPSFPTHFGNNVNEPRV